MSLATLMNFKLKALQSAVAIVDKDGRPSMKLQREWEEQQKAIVGAIQEIATAVDAVVLAQAAADAAQAAADTATAAAETATAAIETANEVSALTNSGITPVDVLTASDAGTDATITIDAHTRRYGDGSEVSVNSGALTGKAYGTTYSVYYDDASRAGGAVTYVASTDEADAVQSGNRHSVGAVTTPISGGIIKNGIVVAPPGVIAGVI